jgi:pimeloyl-ACP methyl ester carboxylesterase
LLARRDFVLAAASTLALTSPYARSQVPSASRTMRRVARNGVPSIAYDDLGAGREALLFMPGWCVSRKVFQSLPALCAQQHRVLALDWRGHGDSAPAQSDFGEQQLVQDALDVIRDSRVSRVIPVALAHSGWVALELRRRLGPAVPAIIFVDWLVGEPPPAFVEALQALQRRSDWRATRAGLFSMWTQGVGHPELEEFISRDMGSYGFSMWSRAGREIGRAYARYGSPVAALASMQPPVPVLHVYAQPDEAGFLAMQQAYAREYAWFQVRKLAARSHFPMFEVPQEMARVIGEFAAGRLTV